MFHQVNVEVLGLIENMSQMRLPNGDMLDIFGAGGTAATARQYNLEFLGSVDLDPAIREGGDRGKPVALAGETDPRGGAYFRIAEAVMERADEVMAATKNVFEIL